MTAQLLGRRRYIHGRLRRLPPSRYYTGRMSTVMTWQVRSTGSADTERLGELVGKNLSTGRLLELAADLGGGKTTFVRGLARGAKSADKVSSPTFTISRIYTAKDFDIHHFDFYRLDEPGVVAAQLSESVDDPTVVTVVEWSGIVKDVLPSQRMTINFEPVADNPDEREITIKYPQSYEEIIRRAQADWKVIEP